MLRGISLVWSMAHAVVLFILLFESRYSARATRIVTLATMVPLALANLLLALSLDVEVMGVVLLGTMSLPSLVVFWILAKHRDGRFFFTFCLVDTVVLEIVYLTQILNYYVTPDSNLLMFLLRLVAFPALEWIVYKKLRPTFLAVERHTKRGLGVFALIGALFYILMSLMMNVPTSVTQRPEQLPAVILLFILIPVIYLHFISTLGNLQNLHEKSEQENILKMQVSNLVSRVNEFSAADDKFRMERHNFRHKLKTLASLIKSGQNEECLTLLSEYEEALDKTKIKRYCQHPVLDAVLSAYLQKAEEKGIAVRTGIAFPDEIPVNEAELATAMANALENALNACDRVAKEKRFIDVNVLNHPGFIIQISNSYEGTVEFDEDEIPVNRNHDHGFGTRFIAAFCKKNGGYYQFLADGERFTLYLNF